MSLRLLVGPPGAGKTSRLLARAEGVLTAGGRVWWVGLPNQRTYLYRRATASGAVLGLEFLTLQQLYYRLLAHARRLRPLLVGSGRLALVGEAIAELDGAPPVPGEARLFAYAVAEAKRNGLAPHDLPGFDVHSERLIEVYARYERLKGEAWDYDDFRLRALELAEAGSARAECDEIVVDGFRQLGPLDLRLLDALGRLGEVNVALPELPAGTWTGLETTVLSAPPERPPHVYRAANPVMEVRWVLRALKRDLACGFDALDLALIAPSSRAETFLALADEFGVPLVDERPEALADTQAGRLLVRLLELPDTPTASRLLAVPELAPLAAAALEEGLAGRDAIGALARRLNMEGTWQHWLAELAPGDEPEPWAERLCDLALKLAGGVGGRREETLLSGSSEPPQEVFRAQALARAKEAARVAPGRAFPGWWKALLQESSLSRPRPGGVALVDERLVSGRRFRRAYLTYAVEGGYGAGEREDFFVPEELRAPVGEENARAPVLPRRYAGSDRLLFAELRSRADELVVTFPRAQQDGVLLAEAALVGGQEPQPLPRLAAGSRYELEEGDRYAPPAGPPPLFTPRLPVELEELREYGECSQRYWLRGTLMARRDPPWWRKLRDRLVCAGEFTPQLGEELSAEFPQAREWLERHSALLAGVKLGVELTVAGDGAEQAFVRLDAATREGSTATVYLLAPPDSIRTRAEAEALVESRWRELWAAGELLEGYRTFRYVQIVVWPLLGEPIAAYDGYITSVWKRIERRRNLALKAFDEYRAGSARPSPGFRCESCQVRDACRLGES